MVQWPTLSILPVQYLMFYPLHPATVHLPLALLLVASLFTVMAVRGRSEFATSAYHCLSIGLIGALIAIVAGLLDAARQLSGPDVPRGSVLIGWVNAHAAATIAATLCYGRAWLLIRRQRDLWATPARGSYLRLHAFGALLLLVGGSLGGHLVYSLRMGIGG